MVAAIRTIDFRQITSVALATDRHDLAKLSLLLGPDAGSARPAGSAQNASALGAPPREAVRRRFR